MSTKVNFNEAVKYFNVPNFPSVMTIGVLRFSEASLRQICNVLDMFQFFVHFYLVDTRNSCYLKCIM